MSMEVAQAYAWIDSTLRGDASLMAAAVGGVWQGRADIGVNSPFALFGQQAASDVLTLTAVRLFSSILMQIVAVGPTAQYAALVTIASRIDALFDTRNVVLPGSGYVLASYREQPLALEEPLVAGVAWSRIGGLYRIELQGSS